MYERSTWTRGPSTSESSSSLHKRRIVVVRITHAQQQISSFNDMDGVSVDQLDDGVARATCTKPEIRKLELVSANYACAYMSACLHDTRGSHIRRQRQAQGIVNVNMFSKRWMAGDHCLMCDVRCMYERQPGMMRTANKFV